MPTPEAFEPIRDLEVENYGCLRRAKFTLTPLHALIGPNASGKTTALRALRTVTQFAVGHFGPYSPSEPKPFNPMLEKGTRLLIRYADGIAYRVENEAANLDVNETAIDAQNKVVKSRARTDWNALGLLSTDGSLAPVARLAKRITPATMVRFEPNALRKPSAQILSTEPIAFVDETGAGLASVYQAINSRDVDAFVAIRNRVRELFPDIHNLVVPTIPDNKVVLQAKLTSGELVPVSAMSDGLLFFLGFAALQYLESSRLFLVDEPENGLHPSRVRDIVKILRLIAQTSQVILATHSPFVLNELQPAEVSVVTRTPDSGSTITPIANVPGFEQAAQVYQLGEFWVSYADGIAEEPLLKGSPRA